MFNYNEAAKEIRTEAARNGLKFKRINMNINGRAAYGFVNEMSQIVHTATLWSAYEDMQSGYVATLN